MRLQKKEEVVHFILVKWLLEFVIWLSYHQLSVCITVFSAMNTDNNNMDGGNEKKWPFTLDDTMITIAGSIEKRKRLNLHLLLSSLIQIVILPVLGGLYNWTTILVIYYEPTEKWVKFIVKKNCSPSKVYSDFGNKKRLVSIALKIQQMNCAYLPQPSIVWRKME